LQLPDGARIAAVVRQGVAEVADTTVIRPRDQVLALLRPGLADGLRRALLGS
jgi:hypothetical protein